MIIKIDKTKFKWEILIISLLLPCLKSTFFDTIPWLDSLFNLLRGASFILILSLYVFFPIVITQEQLVAIRFFVAFCGAAVISCFINDVSIRNIAVRIISQFTAILMGVYCLNKSKDAFLDSVFVLGEIYVYINLVSMLKYPQGMFRSYYYQNYYLSKNWVLGNKNTFFTYFIIFFVAAALLIVQKRKTLRAMILIIAMGYCAFISDSATLLVSYIVLVIMSAIVVRFNVNTILNGRTLTLASFVMEILIVVFRIMNVFPSILGKTNTLTGRTDLWDIIIGLIQQKKWFGYGYSSKNMAILSHTRWAQHAHNTMLQYLYEGGVVELTIYIMFLVCIMNILYRRKENLEITILSVAFFSFNIASIAEFYSRGHVYLLIGMIIGMAGITQVSTNEQSVKYIEVK